MKCSMMRKNGWIAAVCIMGMSTMLLAATQQDKTNSMKSTMKDNMNSAMSEKSHQHQGMDSMKQKCDIPGMSGTLQSTDSVVGSQVKNTQGDKLGNIEELILDNNNQAVAYVVIDSDSKYYPVPWTAFDAGTDTYILDISPEKLQQAPSVTSLDISQFNSPDLRQKSHDYYSDQINAVQDKSMGERAVDWMKKEAKSITGEQKQPSLCSSNDIIGYDVEDTQGKTVGELDDIIFDVRQGNLAYGLVGFGGILGIGQKTAAVPWEAVVIEPDQKIAKLDSDEKTLRAAELPHGDIQQLSEPAFARLVHREFNQEPYWEVFGFVAPMGTESGSSAAWAADSDYNKNFKADTVATTQGTIKKIDAFTPQKDAQPGLRLRVKTDDGRTVTVYAGPQQHYLQQKIRFHKGDQVTVTGSKTSVDGKNVCMATQIKKGEQTFEIRNSQGKPLWQCTPDHQPMNQQNSRDKQQQNSAEHVMPSM